MSMACSSRTLFRLSTKRRISNFRELATSSAAASSSSGTSVPARERILLESVSQIPTYGFTRQAYYSLSSQPSGPSSSGSLGMDRDADPNTKARIIDTLFPGPSTNFDSALFGTWNQVSNLSVVQSRSQEEIVSSLLSGAAQDTNEAAHKDTGKPVNMNPSLSAQQEKDSLLKIQDLVEDRLRHSWIVKDHLIHGITTFSTLSPTTSRIHSILPHQTILPNLPNPVPMLNLSSGFIHHLLTDPATQSKTGWIDPDSSSWYTTRARLSAAYLLATLHIASGKTVHFQDSQAYFRRIMQGRETGFVATVENALNSGKEWVQWGGRGWIGVLRSLGL